MTNEKLQEVKDHFIAYSDGYISRAGKMVHMMEMKRQHCHCVACNARNLATRMNWPQEDINAAEALGFLHDVGRFPQLEEYGTFSDAHSMNHGERGYLAILESDLLEGVEEERKAAILDAVRYHNLRVMPEGLPEEHYRFLKLIRDADRLDIYRVVLGAVQEDKVAEHPEIGLHLELEGDPRDELIDTLMTREPVAYTDLSNFTEFVLLIISWNYQMNYPETHSVVSDRGIVEGFREHLPMHLPKVAVFISEILEVLA